jgi:hypothetical protein
MREIVVERNSRASVRTGISWRDTSSLDFAQCVWINVTAPPPGGYAMTPAPVRARHG